jgi:hypothetical protein
MVMAARGRIGGGRYHLVLPVVGPWRSWERACLADRRSGVRIPSGPPTCPVSEHRDQAPWKTVTSSISQLALGIVLAAGAGAAAFHGLVLGNRRVSDESRRVPKVAIWLITAILFVTGAALFSLYRPDLLFDITISVVWVVLVTVIGISVLYIFHPVFRGRKQ